MVMRSKFELTTIEEKQFYEDVKKILLEAREHAYSNASAIMTQVYWNIGKRIIEQEQNRESSSNCICIRRLHPSPYRPLPQCH